MATQLDAEVISQLGGAGIGIVARRARGFKNAMAIVSGEQRLIVWDHEWYKGPGYTIYDAKGREVNGNWNMNDKTLRIVFRDRQLLLAHEIGHHVCGHAASSEAADSKDASWKRELEADRFAGSVIAQFVNGFIPKEVAISHDRVREDRIREWMQKADHTLPEKESKSHPPKSARLEAIMQGIRSGSPCRR